MFGIKKLTEEEKKRIEYERTQSKLEKDIQKLMEAKAKVLAKMSVLQEQLDSHIKQEV